MGVGTCDGVGVGCGEGFGDGAKLGFGVDGDVDIVGGGVVGAEVGAVVADWQAHAQLPSV